MSLSQASVPCFEIALNAFSAILVKGEDFAAAKKIEPSVLLNTRLYPNMFPLTRQVQAAADQANNAVARLADLDPPRFDDNETTFAELKDRISRTISFMKTVEVAKIDTAASREITFPLGKTVKGHMKGADYLNHFALPNFYFHLTTAFAILRHCGGDVGKEDFLGAMPIRLS